MLTATTALSTKHQKYLYDHILTTFFELYILVSHLGRILALLLDFGLQLFSVLPPLGESVQSPL